MVLFRIPMSTYSPTQLANKIKNLRVDEPHVFLDELGGPLTADHANELLRVARGLSEWHKIMATLVIGYGCFEGEFVDYAIDMLTFPATGEEPFAVILWANNLLISRKAIRRDQFERISQLPDATPGKQKLLDHLKSCVA